MDKKYINKVVFLLLCLSFLSSCVGALTPTDSLVRSGMQSGVIKIGASSTDVAQAIGGISTLCIKKKITAEGTLELWDLTSRTGYCGGNLYENYAFLFRNGELIEIRQVQTLDDLNF